MYVYYHQCLRNGESLSFNIDVWKPLRPGGIGFWARCDWFHYVRFRFGSPAGLWWILYIRPRRAVVERKASTLVSCALIARAWARRTTWYLVHVQTTKDLDPLAVYSICQSFVSSFPYLLSLLLYFFSFSLSYTCIPHFVNLSPFWPHRKFAHRISSRIIKEVPFWIIQQKFHIWIKHFLTNIWSYHEFLMQNQQ